LKQRLYLRKNNEYNIRRFRKFAVDFGTLRGKGFHAGMIDTVLNLGLNGKVVHGLIDKTKNDVLRGIFIVALF
jgi:hypothetical protein